MSLNSVNTNTGAMVALQSLEMTQTQLSVTQKQISTGYRVSDSTDDGAAYAIAQGIRSTVGALTSANQQLGNSKGLLLTTQSGLNDISNTMSSMRDVLVKLSDGSVQGQDRSNYTAQYSSMLQNVQTFIKDANYNGGSLINNMGTNTISTIEVSRNETGAGGTYALSSFSGQSLYSALSAATTYMTSTAADTFLAANTSSGSFVNQQNKVNAQLNTVGNSINFVNHQISYNNDKVDSLNSGLGSLVDSDLAKESAQLTALQIRQQLGTQALSMANSAPQSLMSLFR